MKIKTPSMSKIWPAALTGVHRYISDPTAAAIFASTRKKTMNGLTLRSMVFV